VNYPEKLAIIPEKTLLKPTAGLHCRNEQYTALWYKLFSALAISHETQLLILVIISISFKNDLINSYL